MPWTLMVVSQVLRSVVSFACSGLEHYQAFARGENQKKNHQSFRNTFTSHYNKHGREEGILSIMAYPTRLQHTSLGYPSSNLSQFSGFGVLLESTGLSDQITFLRNEAGSREQEDDEKFW